MTVHSTNPNLRAEMDEQISQLVHLARGAGLKVKTPPTQAALSIRRSQLWGVLSVLLLASALVTGLLALDPDVADRIPIPPAVPPMGLTILSVMFAFYVNEKDRMLRRVSELLDQEQLVRSRYEAQARQLHALLRVSASLSASLDHDYVSRLVVENAAELVGAEVGVLLTGGVDGVRPVAVHPPVARPSNEIIEAATGVFAGRDPASRRRRGPSGRGDSHLGAIAVPLMRGDVVAAVLAVEAGDRGLDELDLAALRAFAGYAAAALNNAQLYQQDGELLSQLHRIEAIREEFEVLAGLGDRPAT